MFSCIAVSPLIGSDLGIAVFDEGDNAFVGATIGGRLNRQDDGQFANFTFGPLEASDNNTMYRCSSNRGTTANAVISVICKYQKIPICGIVHQTFIQVCLMSHHEIMWPICIHELLTVNSCSEKNLPPHQGS